MAHLICKQFTFAAAHHLPNHEGKCRDPHGHTYTLEVFVEGVPLMQTGRSDEGMVRDFTEIKRAYKQLIEPLVEHKDLNETLGPMIYHTTSEMIARWCFYRLVQMLPGLVKTRIWESPTSYAEYTG